MRIVTLVVVEQLNYVAAVIFLRERVDKLKHLIPCFNLDFTLYNNIVAFLRCLFINIIVIKPENFRQSFGCRLSLLVGFKINRRHYNLPHRRTFGKHLAVCIVNCTSLCRDSSILELLSHSVLLKRASLYNSKIAEPCDCRTEADN